MKNDRISEVALEIWDELAHDKLMLMGVALCLAKGIIDTAHPDDVQKFLDILNDNPECSMPRSIKEWFPKHADGTPNHDAKIPNSVRDRIIERSDGRCVVCQRAFGPRLAPELDHRPPLSAGGEHRESSIFATCAECHTELSKEDARKRAEVRKGKQKKWGVKKKSKFPVKGWRKMDGTIVWAKDRKK